MTASIIRDSAFKDSGAIFLARILASDGTNLVQADVSSITCTVTDITGMPAAVITPSIVVSVSVFDTLQTDSLWSKDSTGYNFRHAMPATAFPTGGNVYRVEYKFTPASGAVFYVVFEVTAVGVYS